MEEIMRLLEIGTFGFGIGIGILVALDGGGGAKIGAGVIFPRKTHFGAVAPYFAYDTWEIISAAVGHHLDDWITLLGKGKGKRDRIYDVSDRILWDVECRMSTVECHTARRS